MTEYKITSPCSPGDTLWAIVGDHVQQCKVEKLAIYADETGCSYHFDVCFIAPNPFIKGQMKTYHGFAILGRRVSAYLAAYPTEEEANTALAKDGPDYK